ncbi:MAG: class I SAM-dependent methyltransferase [Armatimonadetes bacterium]|nr:class I SAM-dependent methyltransferase [Armatimonadota bacterium]
MAWEVEAHAGAAHFCEIVEQRALAGQGAVCLVGGCGGGQEAAYIQKRLRTPVVAVDIALKLEPDLVRLEGLFFSRGTVLCLPFEQEVFDLVFYHHVIEHVADPERSLQELHRVLKPGGHLYVGTPNRHRALGYLGSRNVSFWTKVLWNLNDYGMRVRGRFRNELGAHAGFSRRELDGMLRMYFSEVRWLTDDYLRFKYGRRLPSPLLKGLTRPLVMEFVAPAIYALARK